MPFLPPMGFINAGTPTAPAASFSRRDLVRTVALSLLLLLEILFVFWSVLHYPYIQDDWCVVRAVQTQGPGNFLAEAWSPAGKLFYRPLGETYLAVVVSLFGLDSTGPHLLALGCHWLASLLAAALCFALTGERPISWLAGFLYAAAASVHMDSLFWMVGFYDLGGALLFFLSMLLFVRKRIWLSAFAYLAALLTKESTIVLPVVFALVIAATAAEVRTMPTLLRAQFRTLLPHAAVLAGYLLLRLPFLLMQPAGTDQPYTIRLLGAHVVQNLLSYGRWSFESVGILDALPAGKGVIFLALLVGCLLLYRSSGISGPRIILLLGWILGSLMPVIFLPNHAFRYYLTYSLVPFLLLLLLFLRAAVSSIKPGRSLFLPVAAVLLVLTAVVSRFAVAHLDELGVDVPTIAGSNNLIRKGALVRITSDYLRRTYPVLPHGACLVFDWLPTGSFCRDAGPCLWYGDPSIHVYESDEVRRDAGGLYAVPAQRGGSPDALRIDPAKVIVISFDGVVMKRESLEDLLRKQGGGPAN